ncbi:MAG: DUF3486 family protein [Alphaproteobacteria bacterium]|nr:DUF3486 family protein [Alphaproteobacteria bacterium]
MTSVWKTLPIEVQDEIIERRRRGDTLSDIQAWLSEDHAIEIPYSTLGYHTKTIDEQLRHAMIERVRFAGTLAEAINDASGDTAIDKSQAAIHMLQATIFERLTKADEMEATEIHKMAYALSQTQTAADKGRKIIKEDTVAREADAAKSGDAQQARAKALAEAMRLLGISS